MSDYIDVRWQALASGGIRIRKSDMPDRFYSRRELMAWFRDVVRDEAIDDIGIEIENEGEIGGFIDEVIAER